MRILIFLAAALLAASPAVNAQQVPSSYVAPRNSLGQPDLDGLWGARFLTTLERPRGVDSLIIPPEQAAQMAAAAIQRFGGIEDPDFDFSGFNDMLRINGEYRSSIIVDPPGGQIPYAPAANPIWQAFFDRFDNAYDNPEDRPLMERCAGGVGLPPIRVFPGFIPTQIIQTRDAVVMQTEDSGGLRIIPYAAATRQPPTLEGASLGRWEGETYVIETTGFRADIKERDVIGRPVLLNPDTRVTERITRVSPDELLYRFTVEDASLYTQPWTGEFVLERGPGAALEYACHEHNYALKGILLGGRAEAARKAAKK
jgi:hypothetical protein